MRVTAYEPGKDTQALLALKDNEDGSVYLRVVDSQGRNITGGILAMIDEAGVTVYRDVKKLGWPTVDRDGLEEA